MQTNKHLKYYVLFTFFFISLPSKGHIISPEEAEIISKELKNRGRVKITCWGIETPTPPSPLSFAPPASQITFDSNAQITWEGDGILEFDIFGNITFKKGAFIRNRGRGGLRLVSRDGTIDFASDEPQIDFENSEGALSIFYNPPGEAKEKYKNPIAFESHIKIDPKKAFYGTFMFIRDLEDLKNMETRPQESYALSLSFQENRYEIPFRTFQKMKAPFKGTFNFNRICFSSKNYPNYYYQNNAKIFKDCEEHPCIISCVFENCLEGNWGENVFYSSPPLDEDEQLLLDSLERGDEETAKKCIEKIFSYNADLSAVGKLAFFEGTRQNTPLHIAARKGLTKSLKDMLSRIVAPFLSEHTIRNRNNFRPYSPDDYNKYLQRGPFSLLGRKNAEEFRAIDLAVRHGHVEAVGELISYYHHYNMHFLLGRDLLISLVKQQEGYSPEISEKMMNLLMNFQEAPRRLGDLLEGFPITKQAKQKEYERQLEVGRKFFLGIPEISFFRTPGTTRTCQIFADFIARYQAKTTPFPIYNLDGISSRSRIILLQNITNHKLQTYFSQDPSQKQAYWLDIEKPIDDEKTYIQSVDRFPVIYKFGGLTHTVKNMPTKNKPGFSLYQDIGSYENICQTLTQIQKSIPAQKIAKLSHHSRISGKSITAQKLIAKGYTNREGGNPQEDAEYLNKVNFLLDLEVVFRLIIGSQSSWDLLPIGGANARAFFLQRTGFLSLLDLLEKTSLLHPYSDTEGPFQREKAIKDINEKFHETVVANDDGDITQWKKLHPTGYIIKTSEGLHQEFLKEFGGDYESSGEEYK